MEAKESYLQLLSMFAHPVFLVKNEKIIAANKAAQDLQIREDTSVFDILLSGQDAYRDLTDGSLSLSVGLGPICAVAAVVRMGELDYFHLNCAGENPDLRALALASQHLRDPLTNIVALADSLFTLQEDTSSSKEKVRIAQFNHNLHRLLRSVGNMSDTYTCTEQMRNLEHLSICSVMESAVQTAQELLTDSAVKLEFTSDGSNPIGLADQTMLERAVYNMLSNAVRFADAGSKIRATLQCNKQTIHFTVDNDCADFPKELLGTIFFRYRRTPSISDGRTGLGLGIPMVQAIASVHKGSLLVTLPEPGKVRFRLSIPVRQDQSGTLRNPIIRTDYAGGYDHSLIELSDVLNSKVYE